MRNKHLENVKKLAKFDELFFNLHKIVLIQIMRV